VADRVNVPVMFVGGWYDIFNAGSINSFKTINERGGERARGNCRLVMVPYGHGRSKDLVFPNEAPPPAASMMNWFDLWMKNDGAGIERIPPVQYFVMGDPADPNSPAPSRSGSGPLRPRPIPTSPPSSATFTPTAEA